MLVVGRRPGTGLAIIVEASNVDTRIDISFMDGRRVGIEAPLSVDVMRSELMDDSESGPPIPRFKGSLTRRGPLNGDSAIPEKNKNHKPRKVNDGQI